MYFYHTDADFSELESPTIPCLRDGTHGKLLLIVWFEMTSLQKPIRRRWDLPWRGYLNCFLFWLFSMPSSIEDA